MAKNLDELPDPYVDCVIEHENGNKRIGRLNHNRNCWKLSSYMPRKVEAVWTLDDVVSFKVIDFETTVGGK